jgi:hypothetical protein
LDTNWQWGEVIVKLNAVKACAEEKVWIAITLAGGCIGYEPSWAVWRSDIYASLLQVPLSALRALEHRGAVANRAATVATLALILWFVKVVGYGRQLTLAVPSLNAFGIR